MRKAKFKLNQEVRYANNPTAFPSSRNDGTIEAIETSIIELNDGPTTVSYTYNVFDGFSSYTWIEEEYVFPRERQ